MNAGLDFALGQVRDRDLVIESLRETNRMLDLARRDQKTRAEAAEAKLEDLRNWVAVFKGRAERLEVKLAEVGKERDDWFSATSEARIDLARLRASMDRARDLATYPQHMTERETLDLIARLLSGDEERPNPAHPHWFPPDGTGKAE